MGTALIFMNWLQKLLFNIWDAIWPSPSHVIPVKVTGSPIVVQPKIQNTSADWETSITKPYDNQWLGSFDSDACVTESGIHVVEMLLNYALQNNLLPQPLSDFLNDPKWGYKDEQGFISLSVRFSATMNGTTEQGLGMDTFWQCLNRDGFVSRTLWPDPVGTFNRTEYYAIPPEGVITAGKLSSAIFQWTWKVIVNGDWDAPAIAGLQYALQTSPLHFASSVGVMLNGIEQNPHVDVYQHARAVYAIKDYIEVLDSEFTTSPLKQLALDFPLATCITASLNIQ